MNGFVLQPLTQNFLDESGSFWFPDEEEINLLHYKSRPKLLSGEQIVFISHILPTEYTKGYNYYKTEVILEINGIPIKSIRQAVDAVENNHNKTHTILTSKHHLIILENISNEQHKNILNRFKITSDRSADLFSMPTYRYGCPEYRSSLPEMIASEQLSFPLTFSAKKNRAQNEISQMIEEPPAKRTRSAHKSNKRPRYSQ